MTPSEQKLYLRVLNTAEAAAKEIAARNSSAIQIVMFAARRESIEALQALMTADPADTKEIVRLQGQAHTFELMVDAIRRALAAGSDAAAMLNEVDKAELADIVLDKDGVSDV